MFRFVLILSIIVMAKSFAPTMMRGSVFRKMSPLSTSNGIHGGRSSLSMSLKEGYTVPNVIFKARVRDESIPVNPFKWKDVSSEDLFKSKRSVVFALPGGSYSSYCSWKPLIIMIVS